MSGNDREPPTNATEVSDGGQTGPPGVPKGEGYMQDLIELIDTGNTTDTASVFSSASSIRTEPQSFDHITFVETGKSDKGVWNEHTELRNKIGITLTKISPDKTFKVSLSSIRSPIYKIMECVACVHEKGENKKIAKGKAICTSNKEAVDEALKVLYSDLKDKVPKAKPKKASTWPKAGKR